MANLSSDTREVREQWNSIFEVLKDKCPPRILQSAKVLPETKGK